MAATFSRDPADYFEARFEDLRPDEQLPVPVFLYFRLSAHLLLWKPQGDVPSMKLLAAHRAKGVSTIWIANADRAAWETYLRHGQPAAAPTPAAGAAAAPGASAEPAPAPAPVAPAEETPAPRTEEGGVLAEALNSETLTDDQKKAVVSEVAREMVTNLVAANTPEAQAEANRKAWAAVQDVLDSVADQTADAVADAWRLAEIDPDLEHAVNVATYAAIFAMAFGKIDPALIADLALAGLLHDVGVCRVDAGLAAASWSHFRNDQRAHYADHVEGSLELIRRYAPQVPERVQLIIHQHHEKFDGSGYPRRLSGFQIDDVAQLVSMSDFLHAMTAGKWDGQERTLRESFETLEKLEKARTFPEYFNPDVYAIVIGWIRKSLTNDVSGKAADVVLQQVKDVMNKPAGGGKTAA